MDLLKDFQDKPFIEAVQSLFKQLNVPVNEIETVPISALKIIGENLLNALISEVFVYGIVDDLIFEQNERIITIDNVKSFDTNYHGILIIAIELKSRENGLLPTRNQLSDITRAFNRVFKFTPVTVVFKYDHHIALANTERTHYKQTWREGEKVGKVSLLRDIDYKNVHSGHQRILNNLTITRSGKNAITNFESLYKYWQEVLSVSLLNKKFYKELSDWYFWAIKEVQFPNEPNQIELSLNNDAYAEALKEHKGKNVIRLLTRILFIWFIKEKNLIPEELFDEKIIAKRFIDDFTPQKPHGVFAQGKHNSKYYRAILQNLFFATLNQQHGKREFRKENTHQNVTQLMRYKSYLKEPDFFIQLMEEKVPFMNGGLFECLDKPHPTIKGPQGGDKIIYIDGFSDKEDNGLVVPDFLFFDANEEVDLSTEYGSAKFKNTNTRGLIEILKSYKFTITENTPIDEDVALDPELLGKVFENLLASYNPETKTTARKQTGSFYTPREIVNYMVEESLIAYLKNKLLHEEAGVVELGKKQIALFGNETKKSQLSFETKIDESPFKNNEDELDKLLHQLVSFSDINPFVDYPEVQKKIIQALDKCTILDPACGSGAYPMGILQKMVHILHKIDPNNTEWKQRQIDRVNNAIEELEQMGDTSFKEKGIKELNLQISDIENSFNNNELDYGRKLYLIENCIYGVDIQPIATQISKLRFFISLVVDQKVDSSKENFGIRPLPNLEAKFVAANTLIGIEKPKHGQFVGSLFDNREVQKLENELKKVRHKLFSIKSPKRKRELREDDKVLREKISELLAPDFGNDTARLLANWDPYDQNASSPFYDTEWMFGLPKINGGFFDIVIGNPPYVDIKSLPKKIVKEYFKLFQTTENRINLYSIFIERGIKLLNNKGNLCYINPNSMLVNESYRKLRKFIVHSVEKIIKLPDSIFETATVETIILIISKQSNNQFVKGAYFKNNDEVNFNNLSFNLIRRVDWINDQESRFNIFSDNKVIKLISKIENNSSALENYVFTSLGITPYDKYKGHSEDTIKNRKFHSKERKSNEYVPLISGKNIHNYNISDEIGEYLKYGNWLGAPREEKFFINPKIIVRQIVGGKNLRIVAAYSEDPTYFTQIGFSLISKEDNIDNLKFILALLNSSLMCFYHKNKFLDVEKITFQKILIANCKQLPIKLPIDIIPFITIINEILNKKKKNPLGDTLELESEMDKLVYALYGLNDEEIRIIEQ